MKPYILAIIDKLKDNDDTVLEDIRRLTKIDVTKLLNAVKSNRDLYQKVLAEVVNSQL